MEKPSRSPATIYRPSGPARQPGMFSRIVVDYYGTPTPITQMSSVSVPEARMVVIKL